MRKMTIGIDIAKHVFQVHGIDEDGVVLLKRIRRANFLAFFATLEPALIGMEACATSHHWARELMKLGHEVKLMPPSYVKPYVKRGKNDVVDAAAICEALVRPTMRFVPVKSAEQQAILMVHRTRALLIRQRTMLINAVRGHLAELGLVAALGPNQSMGLIKQVLETAKTEHPIPNHAEVIVRSIASQIQALEEQIRTLDKQLRVWFRQNQICRRLSTIPGIGVITATALAAMVPNPSYFKSGREFAAWLGLTPRNRSSGSKRRLGHISKMGDSYTRTLLIVGATSVIRSARMQVKSRMTQWASELLQRKPARLVTVALANKMARISWSVMNSGTKFMPQAQGIGPA